MVALNRVSKSLWLSACLLEVEALSEGNRCILWQPDAVAAVWFVSCSYIVVVLLICV